MKNFMLIPNLKTKFKKSVPLKSYFKKKKKKLVYNCLTLSADRNCPRAYLYMAFLVSCRFSRGQKIVNFENCKT